MVPSCLNQTFKIGLDKTPGILATVLGASLFPSAALHFSRRNARRFRVGNNNVSLHRTSLLPAVSNQMAQRKRSRSGKRKRRARGLKSQPLRYVQSDRIQDRHPHPLPQTFKMTLPRYELTSLDAPDGVVGYIKYRANSLFQPILSDNHEGLGFSQIHSMYKHSTVIHANITVSFSSNDTVRDLVVGILVSGNITPPTNPIVLVENGNLIRAKLSVSGVTGESVTLKQSVNVGRFLGHGSPMSNPELQGKIDTQPTELVYFHCFCYDIQGGNPSAVIMDVLLEQTAVFTEPIALAQS